MITTNQAYELVRRLINFPHPVVCTHAAALDILDMLERNGCPVDQQLIQAVSDGNDTKALAILKLKTGDKVTV